MFFLQTQERTGWAAILGILKTFKIELSTLTTVMISTDTE